MDNNAIVTRVCDAHQEGPLWVPSPGQDWLGSPSTLGQIKASLYAEDAVFAWVGDEQVLLKGAYFD